MSIGAGVLVALLLRINATLGTYTGVLEATFIVHAVGTIFACGLVGMQLRRRFWKKLYRGPVLELSGGAFGVLIVLLANVTVPPLGVALAASLFIAADLIVSSLSDHLGWLDLPQVRLTKRRAAGLLLVLAGVVLMRWG